MGAPYRGFVSRDEDVEKNSGKNPTAPLQKKFDVCKFGDVRGGVGKIGWCFCSEVVGEFFGRSLGHV